MRYEPSAWGSARVFSNPTSDPQCGSVKHIVPVHSPDISLGKNVAFSSSEPCESMALIAARDKLPYIVHAMFALAMISSTQRLIDRGSPWPPNAGFPAMEGHPPCTYVAYASAKPAGVLTTPSFHEHPVLSPDARNGNNSFSANRAHCS